MIIGVTGNFGSGKSTVSRVLAKMSKAKILDADKIAKKYLHVHKKKILTEFPEARKNKSIDVRKLAETVFEDKKKLKKLENILHPPVIREVRKQSETKRNVVIDTPLLIEADLYSLCDFIILVKTPKETQIRRLKGRFGKEEINKRLKNQMTFSKKRKYADYVINNNSSLKNTRRRVEYVWRNLKK